MQIFYLFFAIYYQNKFIYNRIEIKKGVKR